MFDSKDFYEKSQGGRITAGGAIEIRCVVLHTAVKGGGIGSLISSLAKLDVT